MSAALDIRATSDANHRSGVPLESRSIDEKLLRLGQVVRHQLDQLDVTRIQGEDRAPFPELLSASPEDGKLRIDEASPEFLIPRELTEGRSAVRIRIRFLAAEHPLFPDHPFPGDSAWSEMRYWAYSLVIPR